MWLAWGGAVVPLILAYVVSGLPLSERLATSVKRTTIAPNFLLFAESTIWTLALVLARYEDAPERRVTPGRARARPMATR